MVSGDEEVSLACLGKSAQLPAVVGRLGDGVSIMPKQRANAIEKRSAAPRDPGHVFKDDQFGRVVLKGFQGEPDAAQSQAI